MIIYGFIYKTICSIDQSIYIGQRKLTNDSRDKKYLGSGVILKRKIKKYGREFFDKEIIEYCSDLTSLNDREIFWVSYYKTNHDKCLNILDGGKGSTYTMPIETRIKLSKAGMGKAPWNKGKKLTPEQQANMYRFPKGNIPLHNLLPMKQETKDKIRLTAIGNKRNLGRQCSISTKNKISTANKGRLPPNTRQIAQINPITFEIIEIFESRKKASDNVNDTTAHRAAKTNFRVKSGGYFWKYISDLSTEEINSRLAINS